MIAEICSGGSLFDYQSAAEWFPFRISETYTHAAQPALPKQASSPIARRASPVPPGAVRPFHRRAAAPGVVRLFHRGASAWPICNFRYRSFLGSPVPHLFITSPLPHRALLNASAAHLAGAPHIQSTFYMSTCLPASHPITPAPAPATAPPPLLRAKPPARACSPAPPPPAETPADTSPPR